MTTEVEVPAPEASEETKALNAAIDAAEGENNEPSKEPKAEEAPKKEKTPEERERARMQRRIDNLTRKYHEATAQLQSVRGAQVTSPREDKDGAMPPSSDDETLSLSKRELQELIKEEAKKLAPTIKQQEAEIEHRRAIVTGLEKEWGKEKFDALASELDEAFGGLADDKGRPKPATDAIFEADDPRALIEYLADPENAEEAEALGRMSAVRAGMKVAQLAAALKAKQAEAKPQASRAPAPIEPVRGQGAVTSKRLLDLSDEEFAKRRREQIKRRR